MKAYTDLEQSRKLAEILPIESADMRYAPFGNTHPWVWDVNLLEDGAIPCWSLAALLETLPLVVVTKQTDGHKMCYYVELYMKRMGKEIYLSTVRYENAVDACYEMIIKLHKKKRY